MSNASRVTAGAMVTKSVAAHAKVNLVLRVLAREVSGHHGLETLFQRLALHDDVTVQVGDESRTLVCDGPAMPAAGIGPVEGNLAFRAAMTYADAARWDTGWHIAIHKRIPVGGGLGGGSADAAAVLQAMEALSPNPLGRDQLLDIAATLGADVPFLTSTASRAWAWGRGDRLLTLPPLPPAAVELYAFANGVNTGAAYAALAVSRERARDTVPHVSARAYDLGDFTDWYRIAELATNDFEPVVSAMHAGVADLLPRLRARVQELRAAGHGALGLMSGSGATCVLLHVPGEQTAPETRPSRGLPPLALPVGCTRLLTTTQ